MFIKEQIKDVALYTIEKENSEDTFHSEIDNTILDETILSFTTTVANKNFELPNRRELEFNLESDVAEKIKDFLNDNELFKSKCKSIARNLFRETPTTAAKGDLLIALYKDISLYYILMFKIDENNFIKRTQTGNWQEDSGLNKETRLQKGVYIKIPIINNGYDTNIINWSIESIDNLSNEAQYWNERFLDSRYKKGSSRTNSLHFKEFFNEFVSTINDPKKEYDLNYKYASYIKDNDTFNYENFLLSIFGTSENYEEEKQSFKDKFEEYRQSEERSINYVFDFQKDILKREFKKGGFVLGNQIKISLKDNNLSSSEEENRLDNLIEFDLEDENGDTYAKVYYEGTAKFEK